MPHKRPPAGRGRRPVGRFIASRRKRIPEPVKGGGIRRKSTTRGRRR